MHLGRIPRRREGTTLARHGSRLLILLLASAMALTLAPVARGQDVVWIRQFGSASVDYVQGTISVDASGVYVSGPTLGALPGQTSSGDSDAFVVKLTISPTVGGVFDSPSVLTLLGPYIVLAIGTSAGVAMIALYARRIRRKAHHLVPE
ncbi:MAG TPA: hypothetical protein VIH83_04730 [Candidatus Bathyarchaeia archaeon]